MDGFYCLFTLAEIVLQAGVWVQWTSGKCSHIYLWACLRNSAVLYVWCLGDLNLQVKCSCAFLIWTFFHIMCKTDSRKYYFCKNVFYRNVCLFTQEESRMIRLQFEGSTRSEAVDLCRAAVQRLQEYLPTVNQESTGPTLAVTSGISKQQEVNTSAERNGKLLDWEGKGEQINGALFSFHWCCVAANDNITQRRQNPLNFSECHNVTGNVNWKQTTESF